MPTAPQKFQAQFTANRIIIIGAGLAGLFTALKLSPLPVTIISPTPLGEGASSGWAQGGIAAAIGEGDHPEKHVLDTLIAGAGIVDETIARLVANEAGMRIADLLSYGVPFDKDLEGKLKLSREAAHSERRIVRVRGDMAGKAIMTALISSVRQTPSINIFEGYRVTDLVLKDTHVCGVRFSDYDDQKSAIEQTLLAPYVVLASGGIGGLYAVTTNPSTSRGEGLGMAARAGALLSDLEFVQFHPTAIHVNFDPAPLATEALRGEGALLVNGKGERFMTAIHPDVELAPRDIVARAVHIENMSGRGAFLDCRSAIGERFRDQYPTVYEKCRQAGIDPAHELIPVAPAAHYHMGGIWTDANGRTSLDGLWACGEVASTGMHGANRLASNSLLEAVVFAARIARDIKDIQDSKISGQEIYDFIPLQQTVSQSGTQHHKKTDVPNPQALADAITVLRQTMSQHVGVVRSEHGLRQALRTFDVLQGYADNSTAFANMLTAARLITEAALERKESRGGHYRSDFPDANPQLAKRSITSLAEKNRPFTKQVATQ